MNQQRIVQRQTTIQTTFPLANGILQRKCACGQLKSSSGECESCHKKKLNNSLQTKLQIGASNDPLEHEADRVAQQVMSRSSSSAISNAPVKIQRLSNNTSSKGEAIPSSVHSILASSGNPMQSGLRQNMEQRFGHDFSQVRIHTDSAAAKSARDVNAHAYTVGNDVVFGTGQFSPNTHGGQSLLAHELVHTVQQSSSVLRRQVRSSCNVSTRSSTDQVDVQCGDSNYRVDIDVVSSREAQTETTTNLGINDTSINLNIEICRNGTVVNIRPSINLPEALRGILGNVISGSGALEGVSISPELQVNLIQSRRYSISLSGGPIVDLGSGEAVGGQGRLNADTSVGRFGLGVEGREVEGGGAQVTGNITYTPGDFRPEARDCTRQRRKLVMRCRRVSVTPAVPARDAIRNTLRREVYLLFPYARSTPISEILTRDGTTRPATSDASEVRALASQDYQVQSIEGFASPEGPRSRGRRFIGNIQLAENRAASAKDWLTANCPECGGLPIQPRGLSELFSPGEDPEVEGNALAQSATTQFIEGNDPFSPDTEEDREALRQSSLRARRDSIYPQLRRARIVLERSVIVQPAQPATPGRESLRRTACPREVRDAVRNHYRILSIL